MRLEEFMNRPTKEMTDFYNNRTLNHCNRVKSNCRYLASILDDRTEARIISYRGGIHDSSKFGDQEYTPYVWLTWNFKCKAENVAFVWPSKEIKDSTREAWEHHYTVNSHHPEYYLYIEQMPSMDIMEMVCDWHAMSQEFGGSTKEWADKNVGSKWKFNKEQKELIYHTIGLLEKVRYDI